MEGCDGEPDGSPGELTFRRYHRFGAGGAKLIWGEAAAVVPEGRANPRQLVINASTAPALEQTAPHDAAGPHRSDRTDDDLLVGLQLTHSGRYSFQRPILAQHDPLLDPADHRRQGNGPDCRARTIPSSPTTSSTASRTVMSRRPRLAYRIGFDFVDIKQCHRYLLNELLAARTRPGKYGGSLENRTRFIRDRSSRIRAENPGRIIATRLNVFDGVPYQKGRRRPWGPLPFHHRRSFGLGNRSG